MEVNDMGLTTKQKRFVECFDGNATEAMIAAGYSAKSAASNVDKILKNTEIQAAIQNREKERNSAAIATREERQTFWTAILRDPETELRDRLRASELLGKSEGDFLEKWLDTTPPTPPSIIVNFVDAQDRQPALEG